MRYSQEFKWLLNWLLAGFLDTLDQGSGIVVWVIVDFVAIINLAVFVNLVVDGDPRAELSDRV